MSTGHRVFAAMWDKASAREDVHTSDLRRQAATGLEGRVLEIGFGTGANWRYLPAGIQYTGTEPDPHMRRRAGHNAHTLGGEAHLDGARAEALPYADGAFDAALVTFVLCSVDDQPKALAEAFRVLRPGGALHYVEHVRAAGVKGRLLDVVTPLWARLFGNCHPNRKTAQAIGTAGFVVESEEQTALHGLPHICGVARKPAD